MLFPSDLLGDGKKLKYLVSQIEVIKHYVLHGGIFFSEGLADTYMMQIIFSLLALRFTELTKSLGLTKY